MKKVTSKTKQEAITLISKAKAAGWRRTVEVGFGMVYVTLEKSVPERSSWALIQIAFRTKDGLLAGGKQSVRYSTSCDYREKAKGGFRNAFYQVSRIAADHEMIHGRIQLPPQANVSK